MFLKKTLEKLFVFFEGYLNKIVVYIKCLKKIKNHLYFFKRCFYKKKRKVLLTKNILDKKILNYILNHYGICELNYHIHYS